MEGSEYAAQKSAELGYKTLIKTKEVIKYQIKRHADGKANSQSEPVQADIRNNFV